MAKRSTVRVNINEDAADVVPELAASGLLKAADHVLEVSNRFIPIDEGMELTESGETSVDRDRLVAAVSYGRLGIAKAYAVHQHEDLDLKHDPGRTGKFLEKSLSSERAEVTAIVAEEIRRGLHD